MNLHVQGGRNYQLEVGAHNSTPKGYNSFIRSFIGVITPCSMSLGVFCSGLNLTLVSGRFFEHVAVCSQGGERR